MRAYNKWIFSWIIGTIYATSSLADNAYLIDPLASCYSDVMIGYMAQQYSVTEDVARAAIDKTPDALNSMKVAALQTVEAHEGGEDVKSQLKEIEAQLPGISDDLINCYQEVFSGAEVSGSTYNNDAVLDSGLKEEEMPDIDEGAEISISCEGFSIETRYEEITDEVNLFLLSQTGKSHITRSSERRDRDYIFVISDGIIKESPNDVAFSGMPAIVTKSYIDLYKSEDTSNNDPVFRISRINGKFGVAGVGDAVSTQRRLDFSSNFSIEYWDYDYSVDCSPLEQKF